MRPFLTTDRLSLRPLTEGDVENLTLLDSDPEVMRYINGGQPVSRAQLWEQTLPRMLHDYPCTGTRGCWAAESRVSGRFLGWFEFRPLHDHSCAVVELGYRLHRSTWGYGLATEGSRALVRKGFTSQGVRRVTANTMFVNAASRRVMEKVGLRHVRTYAGDWPEPIPGSEHGDVEYVLTRSEWLRLSDPDGAHPQRDGRTESTQTTRSTRSTQLTERTEGTEGMQGTERARRTGSSPAESSRTAGRS